MNAVDRMARCLTTVRVMLNVAPHAETDDQWCAAIEDALAVVLARLRRAEELPPDGDGEEGAEALASFTAAMRSAIHGGAATIAAAVEGTRARTTEPGPAPKPANTVPGLVPPLELGALEWQGRAVQAFGEAHAQREANASLGRELVAVIQERNRLAADLVAARLRPDESTLLCAAVALLQAHDNDRAGRRELVGEPDEWRALRAAVDR